MAQTVDRIIHLAAKHFKRDASDIRPDDDIFDKLAIDSFQAVELTSEVEMEFDVEIPDYELQGVRTFAQLAETIDRRR